MSLLAQGKYNDEQLELAKFQEAEKKQCKEDFGGLEKFVKASAITTTDGKTKVEVY